jgi:hypothetical protein
MLLDGGRQALYIAAFLVAIGSLWTIAWANSLDHEGKLPANDSDRSAVACSDPASPDTEGPNTEGPAPIPPCDAPACAPR